MGWIEQVLYHSNNEVTKHRGSQILDRNIAPDLSLDGRGGHANFRCADINGSETHKKQTGP